MKMKTIWFVVILIILVTMFINLSIDKEQTEFKPLEMNVGDVFTEIEYKNTMYVINYAIGDINGDGEKDMVIAVGEKESVDNVMANNVDVLFYDTVSQTFTKTGLKNLNGQNPKLLLMDLTGEKIEDILLILDNEDNSKNIRVITLNGDSLKEIHGNKENKGINFTGEMIDGVKAQVKCSKLNKELYIDLADRKTALIESKKIDESGKIICENKKVVTSGFKTIEIVELNGQNGIQTTQMITAFDNMEIVDEITAIWKYEEGKWQIKEARGTKVGNLIY